MKKSFFRVEDFWSIAIGLFFLFVGLFVFLNTSPKNVEKQSEYDSILKKEEAAKSYKTVEWYEAFDELKGIKATSTATGKIMQNFTTKPGGWKSNPVHSFFFVDEVTEAEKKKYADAAELALSKREAALSAQAGNDDQAAISAINEWRTAEADAIALKKKTKASSYNKIGWLLLLGFIFACLFGIGYYYISGDFIAFLKGFAFVFLIALLSFFLAGQAEIKAIGFGYAAWAILIGLLISNTLGTPDFVKPGLQTSLFIKTGLVVLGAEILLGKILAIGLPGIFVAWIVTPIVLITTYWFGQKVLKIGSKTLNMTISADMSVCGVSAAVATAAACKATKEELTIAIGLSMIFTSIMMIALPAFINYMGMPEVLGGAWIGGTIDATGAVVAAGAFLGEKALSVAATIKMIQNVLIGVIAFGVAIYFSRQSETGEKINVTAGEIWLRFPKFIFGFLGASILFSAIYVMMGSNPGYTFLDQGVISGFSSNIRGWLFCIAFVSIGLSINFKDLQKHFQGGKPLVLYLCGQLFNLGLTLLMAYIMFYKVFPSITSSI